MAKIVITSARVSLDGVDYSDQVMFASVELSVANYDATNFKTAWRTLLGGAKSGTLNLELARDADMTGLDNAIYSALGTKIPWTMSTSDATTSTTNPEYSGTILINQWHPIKGVAGQAFKHSVSWPLSGPVTRTAPEVSEDSMLLETGAYMLFEDGSKMLLE